MCSGWIEITLYWTLKSTTVDTVRKYHELESRMRKDPFTGLLSRTMLGRPKWDKVLGDIGQENPQENIGVFVCGPQQLAENLEDACISNRHESTQFIFHKEVF